MGAAHGKHSARGQVLQHDAFLNHAPDLDNASISYIYFVAPRFKLLVPEERYVPVSGY